MGKIVNIDGQEYNTDQLTYIQFDNLQMDQSYDASFYRWYKDADGNYHKYNGECLKDLPLTAKKGLRATNVANRAALVSSVNDCYQRNGISITTSGLHFMLMENKDSAKVYTDGVDANSIQYLTESQETSGSTYGSAGKYLRHYSIPHYHIEQSGQQKRLNAVGLLGVKWADESAFLFQNTPTDGPYTDGKLQDNAYGFEYIQNFPEVICDHFTRLSGEYALKNGNYLQIYSGSTLLRSYDLNDGYSYYDISGNGGNVTESHSTSQSKTYRYNVVEEEDAYYTNQNFTINFNQPDNSSFTVLKYTTSGAEVPSSTDLAIINRLVSLEYTKVSTNSSAIDSESNNLEYRCGVIWTGGVGMLLTAKASMDCSYYCPVIKLRDKNSTKYTYPFISSISAEFDGNSGAEAKSHQGSSAGGSFGRKIKGTVNFTGTRPTIGDDSPAFPSDYNSSLSRTDKVQIKRGEGSTGDVFFGYYIPYGTLTPVSGTMTSKPYLILRIKL